MDQTTTMRHSVQLGDGRVFGPADMDTIVSWAREGRVPKDALLVPEDGAAPRPVTDVPALAKIVTAPPTVSTGVADTSKRSGSALIPTGNPPALIGYYVSIVSLLPLIGFAGAIVAVILGIVGLRRVAKHPEAKGTVHAWVAICLGSLIVLGHMAVLVLIAVM